MTEDYSHRPCEDDFCSDVAPGEGIYSGFYSERKSSKLEEFVSANAGCLLLIGAAGAAAATLSGIAAVGYYIITR